MVSVNKVCFSYGQFEALSEVTFEIEKGDYIGLVGPNGSAKTTLIKIILGLLKQKSGTVSLFGTNPSAFRNRQNIGYLTQKLIHFNPYFPAIVKEIVSMGLLSGKKILKHITKDEEVLINEAMALINVSDLKDTLFGELSGGQQQRVLVARAIVNKPELLILDEPTTALDPDARGTFFKIIYHLNSNKKMTILFITHDIASIGTYASKLLYLDKKVIFYGSFEDFRLSKDMTQYLGTFTQHLVCYRHG
ncbi:MAG: metal ABC transporter ATP-binding protein [Nitrospirae bacterium]|nr:metal ABC transporter ATP-binding protein [Nitrospirota bacterium]